MVWYVCGANKQVGLIGGEDFETDNPCDVLKLEELKANMCFVSEDVDRDNAKMGECGAPEQKGTGIKTATKTTRMATEAR